MPLYEYGCTQCKHTKVCLQKYEDDAPHCTECATNPPMVRRVSASSFVLKGAGWSHDNYGIRSSKG